MHVTVTDSTTLEDLLALQLHLFEEEVRNIVDKAVKEVAIEKVFSRSPINQYMSVIIWIILDETNISIRSLSNNHNNNVNDNITYINEENCNINNKDNNNNAS